MKERRYVKLRSDMYEDTKFKIIDTKPERDTIHYIWTRILALAAKVNLMGNLFMSRNIPYTIETLAIEFNRSEEQIKLAIDVFLELEMIQIIEGKIYRVINFAKHQNIKVEEKVDSEDKEINLKNIEAIVINEDSQKEEKKSDKEDEKKEPENNMIKNHGDTIINEDKKTLEIINKDNTLSRENSINRSQNNVTIPFGGKKNKKSIAKKKKEEVANISDEEWEEAEMFCFREGEYIPSKDETIIASWTF